MDYYAYHTEDEQLIDKLDKEFDVVTLVGNPSQGYSGGFDLAIFDTRSKGEIARETRKLYMETAQNR